MLSPPPLLNLSRKEEAEVGRGTRVSSDKDSASGGGSSSGVTETFVLQPTTSSPLLTILLPLEAERGRETRPPLGIETAVGRDLVVAEAGRDPETELCPDFMAELGRNFTPPVPTVQV